jgi:hypothetical protein
MQRDFGMPIAAVHGKVWGNGGARIAQAGRQPSHRRKGSRWNMAGAVVSAPPAHRQQVPQPDQKPRSELRAILQGRASAVFGRVRPTLRL